jgi:hypothetical protein
MKQKIVQITLLVVAVVLAYFIYETIQTPVRFNNEKIRRSELVIQNLKDIRQVQQIYKTLHSRFTSDFDTLINFTRIGKIPVVSIRFDPNDTTLTRTISDTIAYVTVADSLFGRRKGFNIQDIKFVPFSDGQKLIMQSGKIDKGGVAVPVYTVIAKKELYLKGLDADLIKNPNVKDLILGSMEEPTTDGNWE